MHDDWLMKSFVAPTGRLHTVQHGVEVKKHRTLRELLVGIADSSERDLNPEGSHSLRMRLLHDATQY